VNFAAESHVDRSIENPQLFLITNILGTQNLLDCARRAWVMGKDEQGYPTWRKGVRYHQVSTDEVYGSLGAEGYFTEATPLCPHSPYSASKTSADMVVMAYHDTYKMPVTITRCSNNYGPYHFPEKLIPLIISPSTVTVAMCATGFMWKTTAKQSTSLCVKVKTEKCTTLVDTTRKQTSKS